MVEARELSFVINGKYILKDIDFKIKKGSFTAIVGPNGAGKTTLLKIITGLVKPSSGWVKIDGVEPKSYIKRRRGIVGYLPQKAIVNWKMPLTVLDVVFIQDVKPFGFFSRYSDEMLKLATYWLGVFGVDNKRDELIKHLSGGEQQRVSLARCMVGKPELLILDEPNTAIDAVYNVKMYEVLKRINREMGVTIIMVTHDIGVITGFVDEVMCLNVKLHCHGTPSELDLSQVLNSVYGESFGILLHREQCRNCVFGVRDDKAPD